MTESLSYNPLQSSTISCPSEQEKICITAIGTGSLQGLCTIRHWVRSFVSGARTTKDIIKNFDRYEKQIRSEWTAFRSQKAKETFTEQDKLETARYFERLFKGMFGKAGDK